MNPSTPHQYTTEGRKAGVPESVLTASSRQMALSRARQAKPILSLGHLAHSSGAPYLYLREIVQRRRDPYTTITRVKRSGGTRSLSAPEPVLMDVQRYILNAALENLSLHPSNYAYQKERSIVDCAKQHLGARWLLKFDIHDFFDSVEERDVFRVFEARGYSALVSLELARICTRAGVSSSWASTRGSIPTYDVDVIGHLPQGAPTSGALSNAVATPIDDALSTLATNEGFTYTRYSDDMVLSSIRSDLDRAQLVHVVHEVGRVVAAHRFRLHERKTRIVPPGARHVVLGLLVDGEDSVRLLPEFRRRVEVHIRGVRKFGLVRHSEHRGFRSLLSFINHVDGCLAFAKGVDSGWASSSQSAWWEALRLNNFPI
ncbi:reverse transcriptase family protein [Microlunatus antarcticus]|uniref:reverse transcriptase family protein n=1 Tax=Microlunatus antarcticus TaxID=53388 RepID=UPI00161EB875